MVWIFLWFSTFGKNEGLPLKQKNRACLESNNSSPPPNEMEDPENLGLCAKKEQESYVGFFFFLRFSFHLQHLYASLWISPSFATLQ